MIALSISRTSRCRTVARGTPYTMCHKAVCTSSLLSRSARKAGPEEGSGGGNRTVTLVLAQRLFFSSFDCHQFIVFTARGLNVAFFFLLPWLNAARFCFLERERVWESGVVFQKPTLQTEIPQILYTAYQRPIQLSDIPRKIPGELISVKLQPADIKKCFGNVICMNCVCDGKGL